MEFHPVADIFPMMSESEFAGLVKDIDDNGLREPIWLHKDGRLLDGRNRWKACAQLGLDPEPRVYEGDDSALVSFVVSMNLHRRHLSESQRAMVGARVANLSAGDNQYSRSGPANLPDHPVSQSDAADMLSPPW
jgi:ParB-like chromosome segregation protein Spo0J